jgi:hypothetical protein
VKAQRRQPGTTERATQDVPQQLVGIDGSAFALLVRRTWEDEIRAARPNEAQS